MSRRRVVWQISPAAKIRASQHWIGVDIVEWKKAKVFYETHRERLGSFFPAPERRFIEKERKPYEALAMIFAAKEAVFKALGSPWMGPEGFRRIRIIPRRSGSYKVANHPELEVTLKKNRRYVVACCGPSTQ